MPSPRLFIDEDVTPRVARALRRAGFDAVQAAEVQRGEQGISDEAQLTYAADAGRALFSYNYVEFEALARNWAQSGRSHWGIVVSPRQYSLPQLSSLIGQLIAFLSEHDAKELRNQFRYL